MHCSLRQLVCGCLCMRRKGDTLGGFSVLSCRSRMAWSCLWWLVRLLSCGADLSRPARLEHSYMRILRLFGSSASMITAIAAIVILLEHLHCNNECKPQAASIMDGRIHLQGVSLVCEADVPVGREWRACRR